MSRTRRRIPRGTGRDALLAATTAVIGEHGLEGATLRRIADRAGVNYGLITHYFTTREELIATASQRIVERQLAHRRITLDILLDPDRRSEAAAALAPDAAVELFVYEIVIAARRHPVLGEGATALYERLIDDLEVSLAERGLPGSRALARALVAILDGLELQRLTMTDSTHIAAAQRRVDALLSAARTAGTAGIVAGGDPLP